MTRAKTPSKNPCWVLAEVKGLQVYGLCGMSALHAEVTDFPFPLEARISSYKMWMFSVWPLGYNILCCLSGGKGRQSLLGFFPRREGITSSPCADLEDSVRTYLILSQGHSDLLAHPSAEIASGWSDYRLCLAHFGPRASGHFQFPPGGSHLQI